MYFTVTCDGVPIGATKLDGCGVRAGILMTLPAFEALRIRPIARALGVACLATGKRRVRATTAERAYRGARERMASFEPRLGLLDDNGRTVPTPTIVIVELPRRSRYAGVFILVDLGEAGAGRGAMQPATPVDGQDTSRPAA